MHKKIVFVFVTGLIVGSGLNFIINQPNRTKAPLATTTAAKPVIKETPDIILDTRLITDSFSVKKNEELEQLKIDIIRKYNFITARSSKISEIQYISFLKYLLADDETAKKLAVYKVNYFVTDEFKASGDSFVHIDARLTPRKVLEYIQTH